MHRHNHASETHLHRCAEWKINFPVSKSNQRYIILRYGETLNVCFLSDYTLFLEMANVEKWRSMNLRIFMHIGSWDDQKRLSGTQFSRLTGLPKARDRLATALANQLELIDFDGLLISWYYPGCNRVRLICLLFVSFAATLMPFLGRM